MHAEAVAIWARASKVGLIQDASTALNCEECGASYYLHYDSDAEVSFTHWKVLAQELITAHHPNHKEIIVLNGLEDF
jgi:hypothetical protein